MAKEIIQLSDGSNELYVDEYSNYIDLSSSVDSSYFQVRELFLSRKGSIGIIYLNLYMNTGCPHGREINLASLPTWARPWTKMNYTLASQNMKIGCLFQLRTDGSLSIFLGGDGNDTFVRGTIVFPI